MGIPASEKYETGDEHYLRRMFDTLRKHSSDPIGDQMKMWDMVVFDFLIGNTDSHIKNFSLLYSPDLKSVRLSKAYDIVSTAIYEQSTRDMAFGIGGINVLDQIDAASFGRAAEEAGIGRRIAMRRFERICNVFENALTEAARELQDEGLRRAPGLAERMLECGGYKRLYKTSGMA
jgi:serine/threonine-protein kinase HipA